MDPAPPAAFIALLEQGQALETRGRLRDAQAVYALALQASLGLRCQSLALMNTGNVLQKRAAAEGHGQRRQEFLDDAVAAYDESIARARTLAPDFALSNQVGAAWLNRGHAQLLRPDLVSAAGSFEHAISILASLDSRDSPHSVVNLAGARANLAHTLADSDPARAIHEAELALRSVEPLERHQLVHAEMGLRLRRTSVMAIGPAGTMDAQSRATDLVEEGLALASYWESRGCSHLRPLALRLFRLGAQLYRMHQPQFLAEFVLDQIGGGPFALDQDFIIAACEALSQALDDSHAPRLLTVNSIESLLLLETAHTLRAARGRLQASHPSLFPPTP